jgi:plasmid replication initiation protein
MRNKGNTNKKEKYNLSIFDTINNTWVDKGVYPCYKQMADVLGLTYDNVRDISIGRSSVLSRFYKIQKI